MKKLFLLLTAIVTFAVCAAQNRTYHGTVVSASDQEPLIGATVKPVGGGNGVVTNFDGRFTITVPASVKEVTVSYVGMVSHTMTLSEGMVVALETNATNLDEVIVTGYGSGKKLGSVVGTVSVVDSKVFETSPAANIVDALQGQVSGLDIFSNTGEPSAVPAEIRLRGSNSLTASNSPLFILDGAPVTSSVLRELNSNDIKNVTVLKDASATAIYGSRAANGVIVVTTKRGNYGAAPRVTVRANVGWSSRVESNIDMMNSEQYLSFREKIKLPVSDEIKNLVENYGISTDWQDEIFKSHALAYNMDAAVQGGSENLSYYLSLGHFYQDGLLSKSGMRRETVTLSLDSKVNSWFRVGMKSNLGYNKYATNTVAGYAGNFYMNNPIVMSYMLLPYDSPRYYSFDDAGKIVYGERAKYYRYAGLADANWTAELNHGSRSSVSANILLYEQINPVKGLTIRAQQAVDAFDYRNSSIWHGVDNFVTPMGDYVDLGQYNDRTRGESFQRYYQFTYTNTAEYKFSFLDKNTITALVGQEAVIYKNNQFGVTTNNQPNNEQILLTTGTEVTMDNISQSISEYTINSYFANLSYEFDNRYFADLSYRRDGSSKFAPGHKWANFYSLGAMWNITGEEFMQDINWLSDLKLRVNYGTTGNSGIGAYDYIGTLGAGTSYDGKPTLGLASQSNADLTWETVRQFDAGINFGFFDQRLYGSFDFYIKNTEDMLLDLPYSLTTGWSEGTANIGSMRNTGVDLDLGAAIIRTKDWYWGVRVNFNYNKNEVTKLFNGKDKYIMASTGLTYEIGKDAFQLQTVPYAGVDPRDGRQQWIDINGNLTKTFNRARDARSTGKSFRAPWGGGFGTDVRWKGLSLKADFNWAAKKYIFGWYNQMILNAAAGYGGMYNQRVEMLNVWTKPGDVTDIPNRFDAQGQPQDIQADSRYLENSSFLRLKNLTVTYALPKNWVNKAGMQNVAFHFTGRNLLTFTADGYTGPDPEYENNGVRFSYPNTRQYEFGLEVSF